MLACSKVDMIFFSFVSKYLIEEVYDHNKSEGRKIEAKVRESLKKW